MVSILRHWRDSVPNRADGLCVVGDDRFYSGLKVDDHHAGRAAQSSDEGDVAAVGGERGAGVAVADASQLSQVAAVDRHQADLQRAVFAFHRERDLLSVRRGSREDADCRVSVKTESPLVELAIFRLKITPPTRLFSGHILIQQITFLGGIQMSPSSSNVPQAQSNKGVTEIDSDVPELLDWDFCIETPPMRPSGDVEADVEFLGRGRPIPLDDPHVKKAS